MLHLAIIGIVCAVSALSEGTAFIERKNNESVLCHSEGEQNLAKVSLPSYNVVVHNFSDCVKQKITKRTSSFFYDSIIKQYQASKNSSCSTIKNVFLDLEKKPDSNVEFAFKKRNLLWIHHNSKFSTKTLRPVMEDENFQFEKTTNKKYGPKKCKPKNAAKADGKVVKPHDKCNLNLEQKKILLRLKKIKRRPEKENFYPKHLDKIKVVDELDLNKRIKKLVKEVALENQQKKKYFADDYAFINSAEQNKISDSSQKKRVKQSFLYSIKKLFCFHKNFFKKKKRDVSNITNSFPVNKVRGKNIIAKKMARISSFDVSKTKRKSTRFKRNPYSIYNYFNNPVPIHRQYFIDTPYPYSANFPSKRYFLLPPGIRQIVPENERIRPRPRNSLENWPFLKKFYFDKQNIQDSRLKRYDIHTEKPTEPPVPSKKDSITASSSKDTQGIKKSIDKTYACKSESTNKENSSTKENGQSTVETISSPVGLTEVFKESTTPNVTDLNVMPKDEQDEIPDHTLEKPFLEQNFENEYFKPDPNFETYESRYYNLMTDFPIFDPKYFQPSIIYKYELPYSRYLRPRFLKIRHALRNYLFRNNVWSPFQRSLSFERKKRCGGKRCLMPRKCWRSAPLLCVPYIKKSQEDVLKYLIKVMQKMIGKPIPLKRDIFERTKFKPFLQKEVFSSCENVPEEEVYECECETTPVSQTIYPEYIDMCPPPQPLYYSSSKPFSCASSAPNPSHFSCPSNALTSELYSASPYPSFFPYPNSAKGNPELLKSFSYPNLNPLQRPGFNSWPPDIPFYVPHTGLIEKQNSVHYEEKIALASSESTSSVSVSITPATSVTTGANVSNSSQIVVSVPISSNTSNLNEVKTSFLSFATNFDGLPPQSPPTTVGSPTASTDFEKASSTSTTRSACALYVSNSPVEEEEERFSFTAITYNGEPECATITNQNSETIPPIPSDQQPIIYNPVNSQSLNCDACFSKVENTSPNAQQELEWPPTANPLPTSEVFYYQSRIREIPKSYKELYESSPEYPHEYNQFRKDDIHQKFDSSKSDKEVLEKSFQYDENLQNERQVNGLENLQKKLYSMKPKKVLKSKIRPQFPEFLPPYYYYAYDKYPIMRHHNHNMKLGRYPIPQLYLKDFGRAMKTNYNSKSLIRRKREDYDLGSDNFDNYIDYFDDLNYNDEDTNELSGPHANRNTKNYLSSEGTPPSYEMLSELAKAITEFNASESTTPTSTEVTLSTFDSTNQLTKSSLGKSSTNEVLTLEMTKSTPNKNTDKVKNKDKKPVSQSDSKSSNLLKVTSKTTFSDNISSTQSSMTTATVDVENHIKGRVIDPKKSGKTSFFQTNSKIMQTPKNSKKDTGKEEKKLESNKDAKTEEEGQIPTTLKAAIIIKGPKKSLTKPTPKVYPKIYPDSFPSDIETNDTTAASTVTTVKALTENKTALLSSTSKPDIKLQLLAVCEGYLEIVKLIKNQNQTTEGDLDADLARYCENIISQSFNNQLEKPKKPELIEFSSQNTNEGEETAESFSENAGKSGSQTDYETARDFSESRLREKIIANILKDPAYTKKSAGKKNENKKKALNNYSSNNDEGGDNNDNDDDDGDDGNDDNENDKDEYESENDDKNIFKKYEEEKTFTELERTDSTGVTEPGTKKGKNNNHSLIKGFIKKQRKHRRKEKTEKGLSEKVISKEEIKMLKILRKRKKALLSWLFNLKDQNKLDDLDEAEYFDDEDLVAETKALKNSGTIKPKRGEKKSGRTKKNLLFDNESEFPIYAKRYGYDKGGELREVEVLWRKINEKTHEEKILKNLSVIALFMTSPDINHLDTKFVSNRGPENKKMFEVDVKEKKNISYTAVDLAEYSEKTTVSETLTNTETSQDISSSVSPATTSTKPMEKNLTHTYISKPDSSLIVGECLKVKKGHQNTTHKTSRKMEVAKDLFQEYTIEFVNYAVYILPIMLTIIFLFCCLCCALHILKIQQSLKSYRKKTKRQFLTPETSDTTEESGLHSKKKKREVKFKKRPKTPESDAVSEKIGRKKFLSVLKLSSNPRKKLKMENFQKGKKNALLRFLKDSKKIIKSLEPDYNCLGGKEKEGGESHESNDHSETADRRELVALLEEVKKLEMDQIDDKKDLNSVQVQHMTQEDETSLFQRPDVFYKYQKDAFDTPKDYSYCTKPHSREQTNPPIVEDCELYEDINELTELLPCECTYFSKKNKCLRHCDFNINEQNTCKRFLKIFRDSGVCHNRSFNEKNFVKNETENRSFIFNKYRSISMDPSEELMGVTQKNAGTEIRLTDFESPFALSSQKNAGILKEIDNLKRQLISKKNVRLKDDGVLCRL